MAESGANHCGECQRLQAQVQEQRAQLEQLQATVARLEEQLAAARKDSSTSSKAAIPGTGVAEYLYERPIRYRPVARNPASPVSPLLGLAGGVEAIVGALPGS